MSWRNTFRSMAGATMGAPVDAAFGVPSTGAGGSPGTGPDGMNAGVLQPNSRAANAAAGVPYQLVPAYPPFVRLANSPDIVYFPRFRTLVFGGNGVTAAVLATQQWQFSLPTIIIGRTAAAINASGAALPVGRNSLDLFKMQMFRSGSQQDLIDAGGGGNANPVALVLGSALVGDARQPALIQGNGLFVDTGSFLNCTVQTLIDSVEVCVTLLCIEEYGPARG